MPETPEQRARRQIDAQLTASGWVVQDYKAVDFSAGRGIALREVPLTTGPCDYLLLVDRKALGVLEAKKEGTTLSTVADQSARYGFGFVLFTLGLTTLYFAVKMLYALPVLVSSRLAFSCYEFVRFAYGHTSCKVTQGPMMWHKEAQDG